MYLVKYYTTGYTLSRKYFDTLNDAIMFSIYKVKMDNLYEIIKVD